MDVYLLDWANLLLRWVHVITAVAWIGASVYFVWLDNSLTAPTDPDLQARGVDGELWAVHGGGFYNPQKYVVAPRALPEKLHWFYWESYSTWLTGFALLTVIYLFNARAFLIDADVFAWSPPAAIAGALAYLLAGWFVYDLLCRGFGQGPQADRRVGLVVSIVVVAAAWIACRLFAGRAAFLLTGAMLATIMSANVLMVIIPGQRKVMAQMKAGERVDPIHGQRAKQRSVHNTYFTLPVLIAMLSNHYAMLYQARHNWLVLVLLMLAGVLIRQFFLLRHKGSIQWRWWAGGIVTIAAVIVWLAPRPEPAVPPAAGGPGFAEVRDIIDRRCVLCHGAAVAQKGVRLDSPEHIARQARQIVQQAVLGRQMPLGNATRMTDAERAVLGRWFDAGARTAD